MINIEYHGTQLYNNMVLHRFGFHQDEVNRHLLPIVQEVYQMGYDRGYADRSNELFGSGTPITEEEYNAPNNQTPIGTIEAVVEMRHVELPSEEIQVIGSVVEETVIDNNSHASVEEEVCDSSSVEAQESSGETSSNS